MSKYINSLSIILSSNENRRNICTRVGRLNDITYCSGRLCQNCPINWTNNERIKPLVQIRYSNLIQIISEK